MAGDTKDIGDIEVSDPFADLLTSMRTVAGELGQLVAAVKGSVDRGAAWDLPLQTHTRVRGSMLVLTVTAACVVTVTTGSGTSIPFSFPSADTRVIPFPYVIDRGVDFSVSASVGSVDGYLIGWSE